MGWTSVATGHHPAEHGVVGSSLDGPRQCEAFWTRFSRAGWRSRVVAWPSVHPAEELNGVFVTDRFATSHGGNELGSPGFIHPAELACEFEDCKVSPEEIEPGLLKLFMPDITPARLRHDKLSQRLLVHLAELYSNHNAVIAVAGGNDGLWVVHCPFLRRVRRDFGMFASDLPGDSEVSREDRHFYGKVLAAAHQLRDLLLGELLKELGADVSVCVASSGGEWREARAILGERHEREIEAGHFAMSGPLFQEGSKIVYGASMFDLVPTLECAAGLPPRDEPGAGRIIAEVLRALKPEERSDARPGKEQVMKGDSVSRCLVSPDFSNLVASGRHAFDLGRALWQVGRVEEAWTCLEWAWFVGAGDWELALMLGKCRACLGLLEEAAALDSVLEDFRDSSPHADLALAEASGQRGDYAGMAKYARRAWEKGATTIQTGPLLGQALLHLQHWKEAEILAREWLSETPGGLWGQLLLARALYHQEKFDEATAETDCLLLNYPSSAIGWFTRGQLEAVAGRMELAKQAHSQAEQLNAELVSARAGRLRADQEVRKAKGEKIRYDFAGIDLQDPPHLRQEREKVELVALRRREQATRETAWREQLAVVRGTDVATGTDEDVWLREPWPEEMERVVAWLGVSSKAVHVMTRGMPERLIGAVGLVRQDNLGMAAEMRLRVLPAYVGTSVHSSLLSEGLEMAWQAGFAGVSMTVAADDSSAAMYLQSARVTVRTDCFYEGSIRIVLGRAGKLWDRVGERSEGCVHGLEPAFHPPVSRLAVEYGLLSEARALAALAGDYDPMISAVYCVNGSPVGALLAKLMDQGRVYLEVFMVDQNYRARSGVICSGMISHAFKACLEQGYTSVVFTCQPEKNPETVKLAARMRCGKICERLILGWQSNDRDQSRMARD